MSQIGNLPDNRGKNKKGFKPPLSPGSNDRILLGEPIPSEKVIGFESTSVQSIPFRWTYKRILRIRAYQLSTSMGLIGAI